MFGSTQENERPTLMQVPRRKPLHSPSSRQVKASPSVEMPPRWEARGRGQRPPEFGAPVLDDSPRTVHDVPLNEADAPEVLLHLRRQKILEKRRRQRRRAMMRRRYISCGVIVLVLVMLILRFGPVPFGEIQVRGSDQVSVSDVMVAGNIGEPLNVLQVDQEELKQRLTHDLRIEDAKVSYVLPAVLQVDIVERKPIMILQAQYSYLFIDRHGMVIDSTPSITQGRVPLVSGIQPSNLLLGDTITDANLKAAITYLDALSPDTLAQIGEINIGDSNHLLAYTIDNVQIRIGDSSQLQEKADLTGQMLKDIDMKQVRAQYIDLNLGAPFIKEIQ